MKLILKEEVDNLGSVGDEVDVKPGFARNFLIPQGKAMVASDKNMKEYNHTKSVVQKKLKKMKGGAQEIADKIAAAPIIVKKKVGDQGKLFGSVTSQEVAELLSAQGVNIDRRKIQLSEPIKKLGEFQIPVKLHPEVIAEIKLTVASEDEAPETEETAAEAPAPEETAEASEAAPTGDAQ